MPTGPYLLEIEPIQADVESHFDSTFAQTILTDGFLDTEEAPLYPDGSVQPFIMLWFRGLKRSGARRGTRAFGGPRMDAYNSGFDAICVANNGEDARKVMSYVTNEIIGWKPLNSGMVVPDGSLWENSRPIIDTQNRPTRWAATVRFAFPVFAQRTA